ncbi:hypothetical protein ELQ92_06265 [Labedella populi]|uniref:Uncharacterized protein n=1 Tax=Labedella populi TaxID=2498850 RepID=A0A3S3ZQE0_9MICO|nr:hypothetical protein [Labedella populi]RWZ64370.1 hypothetical protein ELQ92_06265 [Labedella populi]
MIRHTTDARVSGAGDASSATGFEASRLHLEDFVRGLGYPADRVDEVIVRLRRERGAMSVEDAAAHLSDWVTSVHRSHHGFHRDVTIEEARTAFVISGAAMWSADTLFTEPDSLPAAHRAALAAGSSSVVPVERPLPMPAQDLAGPRRRRAEPTIRRVSWVPTR